jgi:glucokinase
MGVIPSIALAIDIGGTKAAVTVVDADRQILIPVVTVNVPFDRDNKANPHDLIELLAPSVSLANNLDGHLLGIGLSCCGNIDENTGEAILVPNLHWRHVPIGQMVQDAFHLPVFAATDVRMACLAELAWGAAQGCKNFAWATVGTGYGGYLFLDGKLFRGSHGFAGNFGHMTLDEQQGALCGCGRRGCFETFVAGPAIARAGMEAANTGESSFLQNIARQRLLTSKDIFDAESAGDPCAHRIVEDVIRLISINLGGLVNILDLNLIIMGGGIVHATPNFIQRIDQRIRDYLMTEEAVRDLRVVIESFDNSALIGAAADVFMHMSVIKL